MQSARIQIDRLVDSAALADYVQTSADGAAVAQRMAAYRAPIAKEWRRRYPPAPAFSGVTVAGRAVVVMGAVPQTERN